MKLSVNIFTGHAVWCAAALLLAAIFYKYGIITRPYFLTWIIGSWLAFMTVSVRIYKP